MCGGWRKAFVWVRWCGRAMGAGVDSGMRRGCPQDCKGNGMLWPVCSPRRGNARAQRHRGSCLCGAGRRNFVPSGFMQFVAAARPTVAATKAHTRAERVAVMLPVAVGSRVGPSTVEWGQHAHRDHVCRCHRDPGAAATQDDEDGQDCVASWPWCCPNQSRPV